MVTAHWDICSLPTPVRYMHVNSQVATHVTPHPKSMYLYVSYVLDFVIHVNGQIVSVLGCCSIGRRTSIVYTFTCYCSSGVNVLLLCFRIAIQIQAIPTTSRRGTLTFSCPLASNIIMERPDGEDNGKKYTNSSP